MDRTELSLRSVSCVVPPTLIGLAKTGSVASDQKRSNSNTGGPQTRQLCARKAGLNDTYSFVDSRIEPTTRWYSSIAAPNT
jgi:hypothetical protein